MARLTDKTTATAVTLNSLVHIVNTGDTTQNTSGSSYKADLGQLGVAMGGYQYYTAVTITSAQTQTSYTTPVEVLPNPGVNSYYDVKFIMEYTFNTTQYTSGGVSYITDGISNLYALGDISNFTGDTITIIQSVELESTNKITPNNPLYFYSDNANPTTGDGEILLKIWYTLRTMG